MHTASSASLTYLASRSASEYTEGANLVEMIKENLIAERIACDHYQELIRFFADKDFARFTGAV